MKYFPAIYAKPKIAFLDDNERFLSSLKKVLAPVFDVTTFTDPIKFIENIKFNEISSFVESIHEEGEEFFIENPSVSLSLPNLPRLYGSFIEKFNPLQVIFVDQAMPRKTGLDVLKEIKECFVKKIILTGFLSEEQAIKAFHDRIIDGYLKKDSVDFTNELKTIISRFVDQYFMDFEMMLFKSFPFFKSVRMVYECASDFLRPFVLNASTNYGCVYDTSGSYFIKSCNGESVLNVYREKEFDDIISETNGFEILSLSVKECMKNFSLVLDYKTPDNLALPQDNDWQRYLIQPLYVGETKEGRFAITRKELL